MSSSLFTSAAILVILISLVIRWAERKSYPIKLLRGLGMGCISILFAKMFSIHWIQVSLYTLGILLIVFEIGECILKNQIERSQSLEDSVSGSHATSSEQSDE
jgi:hypothetical protein